MSIYCTYITFYRGNKLPPFYIGSTSVERISSGYHGSVSSKEFKKIWKSEIKENPHLFSTKILNTFKERKLAYNKEDKLHRLLNVVQNPLYVNKIFASCCFNNCRKGVKLSETTKRKIGNSQRGHIKSIESIVKIKIALTGQKRTHETKVRMSESRKKYWYYTPFGIADDPRIFKQQQISYSTLQQWCSKSKFTINLKFYNKSKWLSTNYSIEDAIGKTFKDLGFYKIAK